jgi:hypothetical protein
VKGSRPVSLALVGLFVWVTGCTSYKQIELAEVADYGKVRVTLTDGERLDLYKPAVVSDSIHYWKKKLPSSPYYPEPVYSIPLDQVSAVEGEYTNVAQSIGVGVLSAAVVVGLIFIVEAINDMPDWSKVNWDPNLTGYD